MKFLGYEVNGHMVAASCPATESLENIMECEKNGAMAVILKSASSTRLNDKASRRCFLNKTENRFWCESGFDREILKLSDALKLTELARKNTKLLVIPSVTELTLDAEIWVKSCAELEAAGAHAIQLDFFYFPELMSNDDFNIKFVSLLKTIISSCHIPVMPKLSRNFSEHYAANIFKKAGVRYVSLLDSIKAPMPYGSDLIGKSLSVFGNWMFDLTRQYTKVLSEAGFEVCAGGGVVSEKEASELLRLGAASIQICTEVLMHGYKRFGEIESKLHLDMEHKDSFTGKRTVLYNAKNCANCNKCMIQTFCNTIKKYRRTGDNTGCEGCGLCEQICENDALTMIHM